MASCERQYFSLKFSVWILSRFEVYKIQVLILITKYIVQCSIYVFVVGSFTCSLITAVLTHHLGWVSSIALPQPHNSHNHDDYDEGGVSDDDARITGDDDNGGQEVEMYNSLWAQLR